MKKLAFVVMAIALILPFIMASVGHATTISFNATCDNEFYMYLFTPPALATQIGYGNNWGTTYSGSATLTPGATQYLQVYGINWSGPAGFIGDFTLSDNSFRFVNGTQYLVTNPTDWFVAATGFNVPPNVATSYGTNGVGPWGSRPGIDGSAQWIWTNNSSGTYAYLHTPIYPAAVPEPSTILLLVSGILSLIGLSWKSSN
jgi:hypothetical protein